VDQIGASLMEGPSSANSDASPVIGPRKGGKPMPPNMKKGAPMGGAIKKCRAEEHSWVADLKGKKLEGGVVEIVAQFC
jgi:hypothetical protein